MDVVWVAGFDNDAAKVVALNAGRSYLKHIPESEIAALLADGRFRASAEFSEQDRKRTPQQRFEIVEETIRLVLRMRGVDDGLRTAAARIIRRRRSLPRQRHVEVLAPAALRTEVAGRLSRTVRLYRVAFDSGPG